MIRMHFRAIAALFALFCFPAFAAPWPLPAPDGKYAVGVRTFEIDTGARRLPAMLWYPARKAGTTRPYFDADGATNQFPGLLRNMQLDAESMAGVVAAKTHSTLDAAPVRRRGGFPVLIYSHGLFLYPAQNTALFEQLASHGYIIVSIAHPGDSVDIRLSDGTVSKTVIAAARDERFTKLFQRFTSAKTHDERTAALGSYRAVFAETPLGASMVRWREDTVAVARLITAGGLPASVRNVMASGDRKRLGLFGMSFGGATSGSACRLIANCRAAVNLDGQNFDPDLFDHSVERPFLLMLSDWPRYRVFGGQPGDPGFTPNDYAYERWASAGRDRNVVRVRLSNITHLGYTDLVALMTGQKRDERVGAIPGDRALGAMNAAVLAFFNTHLAGGDRAAIDRALTAYPELKRHDPAQVREWAAAKAR